MMKDFQQKLGRSIATCLGLGYFPKGPGTFTSIFATFYWGALIYYQTPISVQIGFLVFFTLIGVWATKIYETAKGSEDNSEVVIDEWVGVGIALLGAHLTWIEVGLAFGLFRLFDIWKPPGVRYFDQNYLKGWGVMLDDVMAGFYALILLEIYRWKFIL